MPRHAAAMHDANVTGPRRGRFRLSLRGFMVLILVLGGSLGYLIFQVKNQRDAAAALGRVGRIYYDWEDQPRGTPRSFLSGPRYAPKRLVEFMGPDFFGHVVGASLDYEGG